MHLSVFQVRLSLASLSWFGCASTWRLYVALTCSQQRILFGAGLSKVSNKVRFFHSILPAWRGPSKREAREESKSWGPASVQTLLEWTLWTRCFGVVMFGSYRVPQMWPLYRFTNLLPGWCSILARRLVPLNLSRLGNFKMHLLQWHGVGLMEQSLYQCPSPPPILWNQTHTAPAVNCYVVGFWNARGRSFCGQLPYWFTSVFGLPGSI